LLSTLSLAVTPDERSAPEGKSRSSGRALGSVDDPLAKRDPLFGVAAPAPAIAYRGGCRDLAVEVPVSTGCVPGRVRCASLSATAARRQWTIVQSGR
jgi:hypothetical protein